MKIATAKGVETVIAATSEFQSSLLAPDIINVVRGLRLNNLRVPKWIALEYNAIEERHVSMPVVPQVRPAMSSTSNLINRNAYTHMFTTEISCTSRHLVHAHTPLANLLSSIFSLLSRLRSLSSTTSFPPLTSPTSPLSQLTTQSRMDKLVAQRFKFLYPKVDIVTNVIIDGFRLDISFPKIKLNVELDGPSHRYIRYYQSSLLGVYTHLARGVVCLYLRQDLCFMQRIIVSHPSLSADVPHYGT